MKAWSIVGYALDADIYCNGECILVALGELPPEPADFENMMYAEVVAYSARRKILRENTFGTADTEDALKIVATRRNIDRDDERSYDSGDFPKVIFASEEFPDYCPRCALCHGVLDGFDENDYATGDESEI